MSQVDESVEEIAVIGLSGRFPGAGNVDEYWRNLSQGVEAMKEFTEEELLANGVSRESLSQANYVRLSTVLEDTDCFDATFFGYSPREAEFIDPQQRLFIEAAWQAIEHAGYSPRECDFPVAVYAGVGANTYTKIFSPNDEAITSVTNYQSMIGNEKDYLATRVSYKLNLKGPSLTVQTACSTSLVATDMACQSLLNYQCDMAIAGGVSVLFPLGQGYLYQEGMILSPDGHCRAFDAKAKGTVPGQGVGIVVLKRLSDALEQGDTIHAVIKGSATNNDGAQKIGFTAPSVDGQSEAIRMAQSLAGIEADSITYIEAHGTGTPLGDPIEIEALTQAFRASTDRSGFCAIGSVKTNIGHLDAAAGVAGLIKTIMSLKHKQIPPSLHFEEPNPTIDFQNSPFFVNTELREWESVGPRRAGVSSFGIGGTNAHVILEEAPIQDATSQSRSQQLLCLSAKSSGSLEKATTNLSDYLRRHPKQSLANMAYTLHKGRYGFDHRRILVCESIEDAVCEMDDMSKRVLSSHELVERDVVFLFSGQGSQYPNMGLDLYTHEPTFRHYVDTCSEILMPDLELDLRQVIYPQSGQLEEAENRLTQTDMAQPALFMIEYALAQQWKEWGIEPSALAGHSIGEYVAACLAGVMSLEAALRLVAARGRLMQSLPAGAMLSVPLDEDTVKKYLNDGITIATINARSLCVLSGQVDAIAGLEERLTTEKVACQKLHTSHAFHSPMMDPILERFTDEVKKVKLRPPEIPFVSNVSGSWIQTEEVIDPHYWSKHIRQTVKFEHNLEELLKKPQRVLLEVGPGQALSIFARQHPDKKDSHRVLTSMRHPKEKTADNAVLLESLGRLWLAGVQPNWDGFYQGETRCRVPLPPYPFERQRHWVTSHQKPSLSTMKNQLIDDWFYSPSWERSSAVPIPPVADFEKASTWLIFHGDSVPAKSLISRLKALGQTVIEIKPGSTYGLIKTNSYELILSENAGYISVLEEMKRQQQIPDNVVFFSESSLAQTCESSEFDQDFSSFYCLVYLVQALHSVESKEIIQVTVVTDGVQEIYSGDVISPQNALILGPCIVIPQEYPNFTCRNIDIRYSEWDNLHTKSDEAFIGEIVSSISPKVVALRKETRWVQSFVPTSLRQDNLRDGIVKDGGVYLITGGLGAIGLEIAEFFCRTARVKLALVGRSVGVHKTAGEIGGAGIYNNNEINKIKTLEAMGSDVMIVKGDVSSYERMNDVFQEVETQLGHVDGVVHAAGVANLFPLCDIDGTNKTDWLEEFRAKVQGVQVLGRIIENKQVDFCLLTSSLSTVLGGVGFGAYASANAYMNAFAYERNRCTDNRWISVCLDGWKTSQQEGRAKFESELTQLAMNASEGIEIIGRILSNRIDGTIVISTGDLESRLNRWVYHDKSDGDESLKDKFIEVDRKDAGLDSENKIELGKLESALNDYEGIQQAVANIFEARANDERLVCYYEFEPDAYVPSTQLRKHLRRVLPDNMIPQYFVELEEIPRTPNGKVDRKALPDPAHDLSGSPEYEPPESDLEKMLADIWKEVLGIDKIGVHDNFFELGGHSLLGVQAALKAREHFGIQLPLQLLVSDTLRQIASSDRLGL